MRVPMMFRLPGKIKPGSDDALMSAPDIYPTILGLLGLSEWIPDSVEGTDLADRVVTGKGDSKLSALSLYSLWGTFIW